MHDHGIDLYGPLTCSDGFVQNIYMYGMFGGMGLMLLLYLYKPDTT